MSYRQLARIAPTTRSVHRATCHKILTHLAKNQLNRFGSRGLRGKKALPSWMLHLPCMIQWNSIKFPGRSKPSRVRLPNPPVGTAPLSIVTYLSLKANRHQWFMLRRQQQVDLPSRLARPLKARSAVILASSGRLLLSDRCAKNHISRLPVVFSFQIGRRCLVG